jgi:signal transduction histidine kinase
VPAEIDELLAHPTGEMRLEDGRWIRLTHSPSKEGGNVLIASDISFLKEREAALRDARDEAEAANRAKTDFLTNMSHELRTPLSAVIGFSEMIVKETFGPVGQPQYREFADDILHAGRHLMEVITDILDIAKAQSGTIELQKRTVRPEAVMRAAVRIVHEKARDADITLVTQIGEHLPTVEADTVRLRQVLLNLLSNAIKFTSAGGTITADVSRHPTVSPCGSATAAPAWRPTIFPARCNRSFRSIPAWRAATAAPGLACRSRRSSSSCTAEGWRSRARSTSARR